jgi:hypothetical protein
VLAELALIILIAALIVTAAGIAFAMHPTKDQPRITGMLIGLGGLGTSGSLLFATSSGMRHFLMDIRAWSLLGVNIMLACLVFFGALALYEIAFRTRDQAGHYAFSQAYVYLAALSLPLWSLHGLRVYGIGFVFLLLAAVMARKHDGVARVDSGERYELRFRVVKSAAAALGGGLSVIMFLPSLAHFRSAIVGGVVVMVFLAGFFALMHYLHQRSRERYHPYRAPLYAALCAAAVTVIFGTPFAIHAASVTSRAAREADQLIASHQAPLPAARPGPAQLGNPLDVLAGFVTTAIEKHEEHEEPAHASSR